MSEPVASSAAPDDGAACDQLGPITAAALLLCHPARDAGSSSWHKRNNNGDSLPQIFLDTASGRGMTKGVTPHSMRGPVHDIRGIATVTLPPDIYGYSVRAHDQGCHPAHDAGSR